MRRALVNSSIVLVIVAAFFAGRVSARPGPAPAASPAPGSSPVPVTPTPPGAAEPAPTGAVASPIEMRGSVAPLVDRVKGAVVTIQSTKIIRRVVVDDPFTRFLREFGGGAGEAPPVRENRATNLGSGFILDRAAGLVLTNNHVVAGADEVMVKLADNRQVQARVLGSDPATDVAVVKMDRPPADLQTAQLGDSDTVRVGDYVLAIGNPLGLGQTVTMGIVSAKNRVLGEQLGDLDPRYQDFIQTDAAINQGNSGGPLFNFRGEVVGVNSAIINPGIAMNVGFAIPINLARQIADQIQRTGKVARGYLGVGGDDFTPERATELKVPFTPGALINYVVPGSPAEAAGLRPNDVLLELGGRRIESYQRLPAVVATLRPGEPVKARFLRGGKTFEASVKLGVAGVSGDTVLGVQVRALDPREARMFGFRAGEGLAVTSVDPRGPASGVLEEGDILLQLDGQPVTLDRLRIAENKLARGIRNGSLVIQRGRYRFGLRL